MSRQELIDEAVGELRSGMSNFDLTSMEWMSVFVKLMDWPIRFGLKQEWESSASDDDFLEEWNSLPGVRKAREMNSKRKSALRARIKEKGWMDAFREAKKKFPLACFSEGSSWKPNVDWVLRPGIVSMILEGNYDWSKSDGSKTTNPYEHLSVKK